MLRKLPKNIGKRSSTLTGKKGMGGTRSFLLFIRSFSQYHYLVTGSLSLVQGKPYIPKIRKKQKTDSNLVEYPSLNAKKSMFNRFHPSKHTFPSFDF